MANVEEVEVKYRSTHKMMVIAFLMFTPVRIQIEAIGWQFFSQCVFLSLIGVASA